MPALFLGHGSPMNAIEDNRYSRSWRTLGATLARPRAILAVSAHWYIRGSAVTAMAAPRTIHDFGGFPPELYALDYPAPGDPDVAAEVADTLLPTVTALDETSWGLDHGTWSVLVHLFPDADVPVVQLAVDARLPLDAHVELGARLAPLRARGILVVASGNVVHNLRAMDFSQPDAGTDWARRFDGAARDLLASEPGDLGRLADHPDLHLAAPTPDHLDPLCYLAGLAAAAGDTPEVVLDGFALGSLSMTAFALGMPVAPAARPGSPSTTARSSS